MMPSVYQQNNFAGRVNLAASYIARGRSTNRTFDTCFEMGDSDAVVTALIRRAESRPDGRLAQRLFLYVAEGTAKGAAEKLADIKTRDLKLEAAKQRDRY